MCLSSFVSSVNSSPPPPPTHTHTHSFPRSWIKGKGYPNGIDRNDELSERDKEHVKRLYGPPKGGPRVMPITTTSRGSGRGSTGPGRPTTTVTRVVPTLPERHKPVTSLPPPRTDSIHDVQVYEPHKGEGGDCSYVVTKVIIIRLQDLRNADFQSCLKCCC